ncbi:hypothetical protein DICSQDRAFT_58498 [Dichomitus squalens LYAD-421 SS1]|uniref:(4-O-methyl)-D-glucuronate--lignin esterase n=1 Tax=Dichomitus squalens (strain LYAD-421) TaxID=732165 RepID=R7T1B2_DICSQ|nr:uncharacterized protein DICSQDRAFT_58498 [Dichomitus squalens LYAD-421 SS1]EJF62194.1 hypothetical protein DICSQDRAFT_58498 [Dichomitus squalens LYAD-421 SS1]
MIYLKVLALHAIIVLGLRVIGVAIAQGCAPSAAQLPEPSDLPIISTLPDPFTFRLSDRRVRSRADWDCRRAELKTLVQHYLYGYWPDPTRETVRASRDGINLTISVSVDGKTASFPANITLPSGASRANRVPVVIATGPLVPVPPEPFLESGVAVAAFDVKYVANDSYARIGAFWDLYADRDIGVMTAWAWAESKILDALGEVVPEVDTSRVGVVGCSRYGKTALAAAIFDERVKLALVMSSGAEGIGPWRYYYESKGAAEKVENITTKYGYWSTTELWKFDNVTGNSTRIPFDAHELVSLVAPRAILWDEGEEDWWTNPEGSVSVVYGASKIVFDWLGIGDKVGVHVRPPPDDLHCGLSAYPAAQPFVQKVFFGTPTNVNFSNISPFPPHPEAYPWASSLPPQ